MFFIINAFVLCCVVVASHAAAVPAASLAIVKEEDRGAAALPSTTSCDRHRVVPPAEDGKGQGAGHCSAATPGVDDASFDGGEGRAEHAKTSAESFWYSSAGGTSVDAAKSFAPPPCAELLPSTQGSRPPVIGVLGSGKFGRGMALALARSGYEVVIGTSDPASARVRALVEEVRREGAGVCGGGDRVAEAFEYSEAARRADIALTATRSWFSDEDARQTVARLGLADTLRGKIVIDTSVPLVKGDSGNKKDYKLVHGSSEKPWSAGEALQRALPESVVVKAFTVIWDDYLADPVKRYGSLDHGHTVFTAGGDPAAKEVVSGIVSGLGFTPVDLGPLERSSRLEMLTDIWVHMYSPERETFGFDFFQRV